MTTKQFIIFVFLTSNFQSLTSGIARIDGHSCRGRKANQDEWKTFLNFNKKGYHL